MKTPRPRLPIDEVMAQLQAKLPALVLHMFLDGEWVWYCGPSLAGDTNKPTRETLKEMGFRFAFNGHVMKDAEGNATDLTGSWGNSCQHPTPTRRRSGTRGERNADSDTSSPSSSAIESLAALGC